MINDDALWKLAFARVWATEVQFGSARAAAKPWKVQYRDRYRLVKHWSAGKPDVMTISAHTGTVTCVALQGNIIVSGSDDGSLALWELSSPPTSVFPLLQQHHKNTKRALKKQTFVGHGGPVWCLDLSEDTETLLSGSYDKTIKLWSTKTAQVLCTLRGHTNWVSCLQRNGRGDRLLSGSWDATAKIWALHQAGHDNYGGECVGTLTNEEGNVIYCLQWEQNQAVTGCRRQAVQLWDMEHETVSRTFMGHTKEVGCLQFDESKIVSGSGDHSMKVWDVKSGRCEATLTGHANSVMSLQFDDCYKMVSASYDKTVKVWDMRMVGRLLTTLEGHSSAVFCLRFDAEKIVTGSADRNLKVWDFTKPRL